MTERMKAEGFTKIITVLLILFAALAISLPGAFSTGPLWPDGQRYVFNGILIHDMVRDRAIFQPYEYNVKFYAHYPATNLPYGPPFFALVFAAAFGLFGISFPVARCIVSFYTVCAALMCWYTIYSIKKDYWLSILAVSALLFFPLTVTYSRDITPELPIVFFSFLTLCFFYNYLENSKKYYGVAAAISFSLGYLTKPYIIPLGVALVLHFIIRKKWDVLYKTETWLAILIVFFLTVPYTLLSFKYLTEDLGVKPPFPPVSWKTIYGYPWTIARLSPIIAIFSVIGFMVGLIRRDKLVLLSSLWAVAWYVFFSFYLGAADIDKYLVTFIPALALPFAIGFCETISRIKVNFLRISTIICVIGLMIWSAAKNPIYYVRGYETAGEFVAKNGPGRSVLFCGSYDGAFMMGIRNKSDPAKNSYVLRGDRHLAVRLWWGELKRKDSVKSPENLIRMLEEYQTRCIVFERDMPRAKNYEEYAILKDLLQQKELFREVRRFPIETNYRPLGPELIIYKFMGDDNPGKGGTLTIPVPTLGQDLEVKF